MNDQVTKAETAKILELAARCAPLEGDFVELGCYRGDTTVLLGEVLETGRACSAATYGGQRPEYRRLFAYDSFSGLPAKRPEDLSGAGANFKEGSLTVSKREVIEKLKRHGLKNVVLRKAWFSDLTPEDLPGKISFAFIDGDFYESQKVGLKLVAPKLIEKGIIICHDYNNPELPGASKAVDEFLNSHRDFNLQVFQTLAILTKNCLPPHSVV